MDIEDPATQLGFFRRQEAQKQRHCLTRASNPKVLLARIKLRSQSKISHESDCSASVSGFKNDNDAGRLGFVRPQTRKGLIAPAGKADDFTSLNFFFGHFGRLQDVEAAAIEKERMIPKQIVQLPDGGMTAEERELVVTLTSGPTTKRTTCPLPD